MKHLNQLALSLLALLPLQPSLAAVDFENQVRPILEERCVSCHQASDAKGGLRLDTLEMAVKGGDEGPSIVPSNPAESELLARVKLPADHSDVMPPKGDPLSGEQAAILEAWIADGAHWPEGLVLREVTDEEKAALAYATRRQGEIKEVRVYPKSVVLETERDFHGVLVKAVYQDDTTQDVTRFATLKLHQEGVAAIEGNKLRPVADGSTVLDVLYAGQTLEVPVSVAGATAPRPISFNLDVMPVFMREGCNTGACHGSAQGMDGFMLSLYGYDPAGDYFRTTREQNGRRLNLAIPEQSLLVEKGLERVPHSGGKCFDEGGHAYHTLTEWIANGAAGDPEDIARVTSIEIYPTRVVLEGEGSTQQLGVRALYSDGTDRDVTHLAAFVTNNEGSGAVDKDGLVTAGERGESFVMARYDNFTEGSQIIVLPSALEYERPQLAEVNYVDTLVNEKLHKLRITPSGICTDEEFARRAYLDVVGLIPTPDEVDAFVSSENPEKRSVLVDELLQRKEFSELWVMKWSELLQIHSNNNDRRYYKSVLMYHTWLREQIDNNVPINEIVIDLLSASGGTFTNPASNYYEMERDPLKITENVAQVFMGMQIQCAQCHNHPFDRWTMDDYYGFAAFFSQIGRKGSEDPREAIIFNRNSGETKHPISNVDMAPKFLGGERPEISGGEDRREVLARWLASPDNPFFAQNLANRIWDHFFGRGIINPVDDVRISNPPSNPELLRALADKLTEYNYDFRMLIRDITLSQTYQRETRLNDSNRSDEANFARQTIRRLRAEVLLDAIAQVTETPNKFKGLPLGARAVQIADGSISNYFLTTFGRAERATVCACEVELEPNLSQALHLLNGDTAHDRVLRGNVVGRLIEEGLDDATIISELYMRCFSRRPTESELARIVPAVAESPDGRKTALEDVFWALLNSKEFLFNN